MPFRQWQSPDDKVLTGTPFYAGFEEVAKRLSNPVRKYMLWDAVSGYAAAPVCRSLAEFTLIEHHLTVGVSLQGVRKGNEAFKAFHLIIRNLLREVRPAPPLVVLHFCDRV